MKKKSLASVWDALTTRLIKLAVGVCGITFQIAKIHPKEGEIGYTEKGNIIHLAYSHPLIEKLDFEHQLVFVEGVFAHELMHQLNSDFEELGRRLRLLPKFERQIFATIANIMEDPAIEHWASSFFGGRLLRALKYSIMHLYKESPPIEKTKTPFGQFLSAFIQYGDGGLLIGDFTFEEARKYFYAALPYFDKAIEEPNGTKRLEYAKQVFDLTRPLWLESVKDAEAYNALLEELEKMLGDIGKSITANGGIPSGAIPKSDNSEETSEKAKRRKHTKVLVGTALGGSSEDVSEVDFASDMEAEEELSADDLETAKKDLEESIQKTNAEIDEGKKATHIPDFTSEVNKKYISKNVRCRNIIVNDDTKHLESAYAKMVAAMQSDIALLTNQLKRIFKEDRETKEYRASGKISTKRLTSGRKTARVFERRRRPANKSNVCVIIVLDISGSMWNKMDLAIKAVVGLTEVFANLHIPCKVMAYTADEDECDAIHYHFLNWHSTRSERKKLLLLNSKSNNFDGYSIRYAGQEMAKRTEEHKLILVISDGQPACCFYKSKEEGIRDTTNAIKETSKNATVIGVAIDADADVLHKMYGAKFIYIQKLEELFAQLGQKIRKEIVSW